LLSAEFTDYLRPFPAGSRPVHAADHKVGGMADFLVVVGIAIFIAAMLGLIWGLDHV
jgi:hypothetical protein